MYSLLHVAHPRLPNLWSQIPSSGILDPTLLTVAAVPGPTAGLKMSHPHRCVLLHLMLPARRE
jgi:hypothetical protein